VNAVSPAYAKKIKTLRISFATRGDILMTEKPTYEDLRHRIKQLESDVLEYISREKEFNEQLKLLESSHLRRTLSLMKINEELKKELKSCAQTDEKLEQVSHRLRERIKELNCLYDISSLRAGTSFSLDDVLQEVVDFIPPATEYPEITCARIIFHHYEFTTKNFKDTKWKLSQEIKLNNERIGTLEVCYLKEKQELKEGPFFKEVKNLISAIAESIAQIIELDWAEIEIRKCRDHVENLIKNSISDISEK
jgi:tRNA nucleotidyltransferase/poly(A) polymerase